MEPLEIEFKENATTRDRLLKTTRFLIAKYGYDAMATRMIANTAGVALSAINFHFGNKEQLVYAAMEQASEKLAANYHELADEIREFLSHEPVDKPKAWQYIDRFLEDRIERALSVREWVNIGIAEHEGGLPEKARGLVAGVAVDQSESVLAELIMAVSYQCDVVHAAIMARTICAGIMSYMEKPLLWQAMAKKMDIDLSDLTSVKEHLHNYFMRSIAADAIIQPITGII